MKCSYCGERLILSFHQSSITYGLWAGAVAGIVVMLLGLVALVVTQ